MLIDTPKLDARPRAWLVYWVYGGEGASVQDPPCSGAQTALVMAGRGRGQASVLDHVTGRVYEIPLDSVELRAGRPLDDATRDRILDRLSAPRGGYGERADFERVGDFLVAAGRPEPAAAWVDFGATFRADRSARMREEQLAAEARGQGGGRRRDAGPDSGARLPGGVKAGSKLGQVVEFFLARRGTVTECMKALGMERNGVLSHLWGAAKKHGYKYTLDKGTDSCVLVPPS